MKNRPLIIQSLKHFHNISGENIKVGHFNKALMSILIIFLSMFIPLQLFSQSSNFIYGKVLDSKTKEPLPFASIILQNNNLGVISNLEGDFRIANKTLFHSDSLIISFIGYKDFSIPIKKLMKNETNTILLIPISINITEVNIVASAKKIDSKSIIKRAIKNIPANYPEKPFNYISYYRDYQRRDKKYYNLNEAIIQTLDSGVQIASTENRYRLLDFKQNTDFDRFELPTYYDSLVSPNENANKFIKFGTLPDQGGNELFILMNHDPVRNFRSQTFSFVNIFSKNFISNHHFSKPTPVYENNLMLYKINFTAKPYLTKDSLFISGAIFIQPLNYAIHKLEYSGAYILKGDKQKKMFDIQIGYGCSKSEDPGMGLKYISFNNIFDVVDKKDTSYFRLIGTQILPQELNISVTLEFNHIPDSTSASNKDLYEIEMNGKMIKPQTIRVSGRKVMFNIKDKGTLAPKLTVSLKDIKDINGQILNKKKIIEFYQYRELFVQEFNKPIAFEKSSYLKNLPLEQNYISNYTGIQKYWMNSPINSDTLGANSTPDFIAQENQFDKKVNQNKIANEKLSNILPVVETSEIITNAVEADFPINKYLKNVEKTIGPDQVFVQLDKSLYAPGDTIYFQSYIRNRFTGFFETKNLILYTLLFDPQKTMVDSARFRILESTASGWMLIPENAKPGRYRFAAFTSDMQNYDPAEAFQLDIQVKESGSKTEKIEIVFNKGQYNPKDTLVATIRIKDQSGAPLKNQKFNCDFFPGNESSESIDAQTNKFGLAIISLVMPDSIKSMPRLKVTTKGNNEESTVKEVSIPYQNPYFELRFLPEGGTFIEGLTQRVGFNATNYKGQPEPIEGLLKDRTGIILDTIRSGNYGPGEFSCVARPGLYVELINSSASQKIWPLPIPEINGVSLHVAPVNDRSFAIEIQSDFYTGEIIMVSCIMNTTPVLKQYIKLDKKRRIIVETKELPAGVAQITVFDSKFKPLAERLIYVNADKHLCFNIKTDSISEQESELSISVSDNSGNPMEGIFSISVIDSLRGTAPEIFTPEIEFTMNFHPYLLSNLPGEVLAFGIENMSNEDRDLLFRIYGWSRFNWNSPIRKDSVELVDYEQLKMKVIYASKNRRSDRVINLFSMEESSLKQLVTDSNDEISLPLDSLPDATRSVTLMPVVKDKNSAPGVLLSIPFNEKYFRSEKLFIQQPTVTSDEYKVYNSYQNIPLDKKMFNIEEVEVIGFSKDKKVYQNEYEEKYKNSYIRSLDPVALRTSFSLTDALNKLGWISDKALIVLDGNPLYEPKGSSSWDMVRSLSPTEISSLSFLRSKAGFARYGEAANYGVIFINTYAANPSLNQVKTKWTPQNAYDKMLVPFEIYHPYKEFYCPTKLDYNSNLLLQNRATIYWNPEVYFNGNEPVKIKFNNPKSKGTVSIILNGISFTDFMGSEKKSLLIR